MLPSFDAWLSGAVAADVAVAGRGDAAGLARRQSRRLEALLASARRSRFYARHLGADPSRQRLADLPPVRKRDLMAAFDDWVTDPALNLPALRRFLANPAGIGQPFAGRYFVWESSGSSGEPGVFVQDAAAMAAWDALELVRRPLPRRSLQAWLSPWMAPDRAVFVGATGGHFASTVAVERLRRLHPLLSQRMSCLSFLQPLPRLVGQLQAAAPTVLATYPSAALMLAEEQAAGRLRLALNELWTGGETMTSAMRQRIASAFGCPVRDSYGASECLCIASECEHGRLHCNTDWLVLEPVDEAGRPVPAGTLSDTVLLTNLANHVQPILRYDLGDRVRMLASRCPCGSPLPGMEVEGRLDDTLEFEGQGGGCVRLLPLAVSTVIEEGAGLFDFQLVQWGPDELLLSTGLRGEEASHALRRAHRLLAAFLAQQGLPHVQVRCQSASPGQPGNSGKVQRVVRRREAETARDYPSP